VATIAEPSTQKIVWQILRVAVPMYPQILLMLCANIWGGILVGRSRSTEELAAYGMGVVLTQQTGFSLIWGTSNTILTVSSQAFGAQAYNRVGLTLQRAVLVMLLFVDIPMALFFIYAYRILMACGQPEEVSIIVGRFALVRIPGLVFATLSSSMAKTLTAIQKTQYILVSDVMAVLTNVGLSLVIIPRLGAVGAAVASVSADGMQALVIWGLAFRDSDLRSCWPGWSREAWRGWGVFIRLGIPSVLLLGFEVWVWDAQTFLAGYISPVAQATQSVVPQFTCIMYAAGQSLGNGGASVIGNFLGEGLGKVARRAAAISVAMTCILMVCQALTMLVLQDQIPHLFTSQADLLDSISSLLPLCIFFSFLDGHQCVLTGILIGVGKQTIATPLIFVSYWVIAVPIGVTLAFGGLGFAPRGLRGLWTGMLIGVICHVVCFSIAVLSVRWHKASHEARERIPMDAASDAVGSNELGTSLVEIGD